MHCMGHTVSSIVVNLVMEYVENRALSEFENPSKVWKRYIDDTLL